MTLLGPDGSHHQDGMTVPETDWAWTAFVIWRASIGRRVDRTFRHWLDEARAHGTPFCAYHFVYQLGPRKDTTSQGVSAAEQAEALELATGGDRSIPVMLDWEHDGTISRANWDDVLTVAAAIRQNGYRVPLFYTGQWYWEQMGRPNLAGFGMELVNSNYGNNAVADSAIDRYRTRGGDDSNLWALKYGGLSPSIWQFGSQVRWGDRNMDMNAVRDPAVIDRCFLLPRRRGELYPHGYDGDMWPMERIEATKTVRLLHPEVWRRFRALMVYARSQGVQLGVGTGWRIQPVNPDGTAKPGFALPGNSNHEGFPADGESAGAIAIDTVPEVSWPWMEKHLAAYGLRSFRIPSSWGYSGRREDWHVQAIEAPASRNWRTEPWVLPTFNLPEDIEVITDTDRAAIVTDVMAAVSPSIEAVQARVTSLQAQVATLESVLPEKILKRYMLSSDPSGRPASAESMIGWLRRDMVLLRTGRVDWLQDNVDQVAEAVAARVGTDATAAQIAEAVLTSIGSALTD